MHLNALLDVVAVESEDQLSLLLELRAPQSEAQAVRPPHTLQAVLDRSGSMGGGQLDAAKHALHDLVGKLAPTDRFGLVAFDDQVQVVVPAGEVGDGHAARAAIASVHPGGMTNLSSGLLRGIDEARRVKGEGGATILLLSDGHANDGITDPRALGDHAGQVRRDGITIGTIGIGLGYDEALLSAVAVGGTGNVHFAEEADAIGGALASEVDGLLEQVVQAASLIVTPGEQVRSVTLFNDLPVSELADGFMVELGDFSSGEDRKLLLRADIPALQDLGLAEVCRLTLRWTDVATMKTETVTVPVHVGVVPGDQAAGRIPKPEVRTEFAYQQAQKSRKDAADALRRGDRGGAADMLRDAGDFLGQAAAAEPASMGQELHAEASQFLEDADEARYGDAGRSAKRNEASFNINQRKRRAMARSEAERIEREQQRGSGRGGTGSGGGNATGTQPGDGKFG